MRSICLLRRKGGCDVDKHDFERKGCVKRNSAVARGGAGGARAPQFFFLKSKNRPV